jgi:hypothetical protein
MTRVVCVSVLGCWIRKHGSSRDAAGLVLLSSESCVGLYQINIATKQAPEILQLKCCLITERSVSRKCRWPSPKSMTRKRGNRCLQTFDKKRISDKKRNHFPYPPKPTSSRLETPCVDNARRFRSRLSARCFRALDLWDATAASCRSPRFENPDLWVLIGQ